MFDGGNEVSRTRYANENQNSVDKTDANISKKIQTTLLSLMTFSCLPLLVYQHSKFQHFSTLVHG